MPQKLVGPRGTSPKPIVFGDEYRFGGSCESGNLQVARLRILNEILGQNTHQNISKPVLVVNQVAADHYDLCFYESPMDEFSDVAHS